VGPGLSAEQLADKLVLSPETEQDLFFKRDYFELVVYYDASTQSEGFLTRPQVETEVKLKQLHEALYDFNQDKPLQRPPIFLVGGIAAWVDLMGMQALQASDTMTRVKPGRPIQRRPAKGDGPVQLPKRRVREYDPLDADEARKWRDRAISESVPSAPVTIPEDSTDEVDIVSDHSCAPNAQRVDTIRSFQISRGKRAATADWIVQFRQHMLYERHVASLVRHYTTIHNVS
jgi:ubiquitin carboxyl-terminal hydrolase 8